MSEHPIIFSGPMVRAILDGRKTQTRRVVTPQPTDDVDMLAEACEPGWHGYFLNGDDHCYCGQTWRCPYGVPGDVLWVMETWAKDVQWISHEHGPYPHEIGSVAYRADGDFRRYYQEHDVRVPLTHILQAPETGHIFRIDRWRPSIHMPRWACRLTLEVVSVRVERVQEISEADAVAEGVSDIPYLLDDSENELVSPAMMTTPLSLLRFRQLWDTINAKPRPRGHRDVFGNRVITHYDSYPWDAIRETREYRGKPWHVYGNPWVFPVEFKQKEAAA